MTVFAFFSTRLQIYRLRKICTRVPIFDATEFTYDTVLRVNVPIYTKISRNVDEQYKLARLGLGMPRDTRLPSHGRHGEIFVRYAKRLNGCHVVDARTNGTAVVTRKKNNDNRRAGMTGEKIVSDVQTVRFAVAQVEK